MTLFERGSTAVALATGLLLIRPALAQAPASPNRPWAIPESAITRAAQLEEHRDPVPQNTSAWRSSSIWPSVPIRAPGPLGRPHELPRPPQGCRSQYLPQLSFEALGGYEHTPLPAPKSLIPKGFFESNTQEFIPSLALKWLLFDFGRRAAALEGTRADSFTANVAFTGTHQAVILNVSQAYFDLGAARGRLHAAQKALSTAQTTQDATNAKRNNGLATVVSVAQAERQTAQSRYNLTAAEGTTITAMANLVATLGIDVGTALDVADSSEIPLPAAPQDSVQAMIKQALIHRPDVLASLGQVDSAEASLRVRVALTIR